MWWIVIAVLVFIALVADWLIVMGTNPKKWKGGKDHDRSNGSC